MIVQTEFGAHCTAICTACLMTYNSQKISLLPVGDTLVVQLFHECFRLPMLQYKFCAWTESTLCEYTHWLLLVAMNTQPPKMVAHHRLCKLYRCAVGMTVVLMHVFIIICGHLTHDVHVLAVKQHYIIAISRENLAVKPHPFFNISLKFVFIQLKTKWQQ